MIDADRYHHTGRTYVNIFRAPRIVAPVTWGSRPRLWICRAFGARSIPQPSVSGVGGR
jgi:hypothetical protein